MVHMRISLNSRPFPLLLMFLFPLMFGLAGCSEGNASPQQSNVSSAVKTEKSGPPTAVPSAAFATESSAASQASKAVQAKNTSASAARIPKVRYRAGEDPEFAKQKGWPVKSPAPLPGSILPEKRILAYYGNPLSKKMGALGEYRKEEMLQRLKREQLRWEAADPSRPVQPALHLIAVVAQGTPGKAEKYRMIMPDAVVNQVYGWAKEAKAILFIDIQTGHEISGLSFRASSGS